RFDGDDDIILWHELGRFTYDADRRGDRLTADLQAPAMLTQRFCGRASGNRRHIDARVREARADQSTNRSRADDTDLHHVFGRLSTMRFAFPSERSIPPGCTTCTSAVTPIRFLIRCASVVPAVSPSACPASAARATRTVNSSSARGRAISS